MTDLADLYLRILDAALTGHAPEGVEGIYYPATEFFTWADVSHRIGEVLYAKGLIPSPVATSGLPPGWFWGSNVRMKSTNGERLGWKPTHGGTEAMLEGIAWDTELLLRTISNR